MMLELEDIIEMLEDKFLTSDELEEIWENEHIESIENNGLSSLHYGYTWFTVTLDDGTEYDIYVC